MDEKEAYLQRIEFEILELCSRLDDLRIFVLEADADATIDELEVEELESTERTVRQKFEELQRADEESWETLNEEMEHAMEDLRKAVQMLVPTI
ncbi:hypothetical protein MJD09_09050 [bacterium]|nr:hypothetical protein [bacterium]